jgi:hypothetical protein
VNASTANNVLEEQQQGLSKIADSVALPGSSQEVAAVAYSFSKLSPQLPEYSPVFAAVANGINSNTWRFSRLEAGLIGTALVDVQTNLDALPALVRPVLQNLHRADDDSKQVDQALTIDELRYLVHACTSLPRPGIKVEEVEVLATHTQRLIGSANFAKAAHLVVSWLRVRAPAEAKQHYLDALSVVCKRIASGERPTHPAHPLLISDMSSAIEALLTKEGHRDPPPITPPLVRDIVGALMQISRGLLSQVDTRPPKGEALNFVDWVSIVRLVVEFCDEHGSGANSEASRILPGWAAEALGFVVLRAHRPLAAKTAPDLESLLTALRLLRRYKANPAPDRSFFVWVAKQLALCRETARDSVTLAEIVGELVPQLPPSERARFARTLFTKAQDVLPLTVDRERTAMAAQDDQISMQQLLKTADSSAPLAGVATVAPLKAPAGAAPSPVSMRSPLPHSMSKTHAKVSNAKNSLWGRLSPARTSDLEISPEDLEHERMETVGSKQAKDLEHQRMETSEPKQAKDIAENRGDIPGTKSADIQLPDQDLRLYLKAALERVEMLEKKLEEQSSGLRGEVANLQSRVVAVEVKATAKCQRSPPDVSEAALMPQFPAMPQLADLDNIFPDTKPTQSTGVPARSTTLHLRRPFNFEELRRAESQSLQNTRLRVLVPPDPMHPFPRR